MKNKSGQFLDFLGGLDEGFRIHIGEQSLSGGMGFTLLGREHVGESVRRQGPAIRMETMDLPIVLELVIEVWLLEASSIDSSKAAIYAVDAHFIRAQTNNGSKFEVCFVNGLDLDMGVPDPEDPQR